MSATGTRRPIRRSRRKGYMPLGYLAGLIATWAIFVCYLPYLVRML